MRRTRIAAFLAGLNREYQREFAKGMVDAAQSQDIDLCLFTCQGATGSLAAQDDLSEASIFDLPNLEDFDGMTALCATVATTQSRQHLHDLLRGQAGKPQIIVDDDAEQAIHMSFHDADSVRELTLHMLDVHHCRRFFIITGPKGNPVADTRARVCVETLAERGIQVPDDCIYDGHWVREGGEDAVRGLIERGESMPEVFICGNDDMAFGAINVLEEHGYRVPEDVRVTGFDARSEAVGRGLTTILRPVRDAGIETVRTLAAWIAGNKPQNHDMLLNTRVIYGSSCGCNSNASISRHYVRLLSQEHRAMEYSILQTSSFSNALAAVVSESEAGHVMNRFAERWNMQDFHVCIDPDCLRTGVPQHHLDPSRQLTLLSSTHRGVCAEQQQFNIRSLLPLLEQERSEPLALVFCPLYYLERNFGYTVLGVDFATTLTLYPLLTLLGSGLMSLYLQFRVRSYAKALEDLSVRDSLTGLLNRRGFQKEAPAMMEQARAQKQIFMMLSADMDDMKIINDRYGHLSGDKAIVRMGAGMHELDRLGVVSVHISGDEFLAFGILPNEETAASVETMFHLGIERVNREDPWVFNIEASVGVYYAVPTEADSLDFFRSKADSIMYERKRQRKLRRMK